MDKIDWNAPLETTPDARNPEPVPCVVVRTERKHQIVHICADWTCATDGYQAGNTEWWYADHENGVSNSWLPILRNVQP